MNDIVMAAFQLGACFFLCLSIAAVFRDRQLKGVSVWMIGFFTTWTVFGSYNWFVLNQYWSFVTSTLMTILYLIWLAVACAAKAEQDGKQERFLGFRQMMRTWDEIKERQ